MSTSFGGAIDAARSRAPQLAAGKGAFVSPPDPAAAKAAPCDLQKFIGRATGTGQCVALVQAAHPGLGPTAHWVRGQPVQGNTGLPRGTPIATFAASGHYANAMDGSSHAAIYLGQTVQGVQVLDQWAGRRAGVRTIPWSNPGAAAANTGTAFHVVGTSRTAAV